MSVRWAEGCVRVDRLRSEGLLKRQSVRASAERRRARLLLSSEHTLQERLEHSTVADTMSQQLNRCSPPLTQPSCLVVTSL